MSLKKIDISLTVDKNKLNVLAKMINDRNECPEEWGLVSITSKYNLGCTIDKNRCFRCIRKSILADNNYPFWTKQKINYWTKEFKCDTKHHSRK